MQAGNNSYLHKSLSIPSPSYTRGILVMISRKQSEILGIRMVEVGVISLDRTCKALEQKVNQWKLT